MSNPSRALKAGLKICEQLRPPLIYVLLVVSLVVFCVGVVLLVLYAC